MVTESGNTDHVGCWNDTLRQRLGRFVRKALSVSKCDRVHEISSGSSCTSTTGPAIRSDEQATGVVPLPKDDHRGDPLS